MRMLLIGIIIAGSFAASAEAQSTRVDGYVRSDGTYVAPHYRSRPDSSIYNNWSTRPNVNPYTGAQGTQNPIYVPRAMPSPRTTPLYCKYSPAC